MNVLDDINFAMVQMNIANEPMQNAKRFVAEAKYLASSGADVIIGPEMMLAQYIMGDRYEDDAFVIEVRNATQYIIDKSVYIDAVLIFGGIATGPEGSVGEDGRLRKYNAAFVVKNGDCIPNDANIPYVIKSLMPNYRIFDDDRHFYSLRKYAMSQGKTLADVQKPFTVMVNGKFVKLGIMICEDMWDGDYAEKPASNLANSGAEILINLSCSPWSWRKNRKRDEIIRNICQDTGLPFIYVNNVGCQNNGKNFIVFDGASTAYNASGEIIRMIDRYEDDGAIVDFSDQQVVTREEESDISELARAITVATDGFLNTLPPSINSKVVIGVSGGIDSAVSTAFFTHMLGKDGVIGVSLPNTGYTSDETRHDGKKLCENLGIEYREIPIDAVVTALCDASGVQPGTAAYKTAQAITRKTTEAAIGAEENAFLICNAIWPENAFGYGTLNGDQRGVFAPWANCLKQDMYRLAHYFNEEVFGREVIPQSIIDRPPMDELGTVDSEDRSDPFDYGHIHENGYHDQMVRAIVAFRRNAEWFVEQYLDGTLETELQLPAGKLRKLFPEPVDFIEDLERCFNLFHNQVFKRVQSVPAPLVDKRSFGWDLRESILPWVQTARYNTLKERALMRELVAAE